MLPRIGLGCMRLSTEPTTDPGLVIQAALDAGVRLFDTATAYCAHDDLGENERLLAKALSSRPDAIIVSKGGLRRPGGAWRPDGRAKSILEDAERTVASLGRAPDLYLLHAPDPSVPFATSVRALGEVLSRGLAKRIGLSNVTVGQIDEALTIAPISAVQQSLSIFDDRARLSGVLARCFERGLDVMAHSPLGGPKRISKLTTSSVLRELAAAHRVSEAAIALAAVLDLNPLVSVIPGARRPQTIIDAAAAGTIVFTEAERARLREAFPALAAPEPAVTSASNTRSEVVLLMGIQGSGKSRLVDEYVSNGFARFNRDLLGGTLKDTALAMSRALAQGTTHAVLDNTYTTRASRASTIEAAKKQAAKVRGLWLDVPLHEAQVNVIQRMLDAHGRLLDPDELKKQRDNTGLTPLSHFRTVRELELPSKEEGFDVLETRPFVRAARAGGAGRFVAFEVAATVERSDEPTFVFAWTETDRAAVETAAQRLGATALICPHGGGPPTCWCRPPLPGLILDGCHRAKLSPQKCVVIGSTETHQMLAATIGARFAMS